MTQDRRITDKLPGHSLQWDDSASPAAAVPEGALPPPAAYGYVGLTGHDPRDGHKQLIGVSVQPSGSYMKDREVKLYTEAQLRSAVEADRARQHQSGHMPPFAAPAGQQGAWVAVEDQMLPMDQQVLVYMPNNGDPVIEIETWGELYEAPVSFSSQTICTGEGWERNEFEDITHWMPLPPAPDESNIAGAARQGGDRDSTTRNSGAVAADRAQQGEPAGWRDALEQARYALGKAPDLHALGFNECLANSLPPGQPDETGCTAGEYAQAAEGIRVAIRKARNMVKDALYGIATKAAAPADAPINVEYGRIVQADERALRAADALDGMGFTYDKEIGWLPPKREALAVPADAEEVTKLRERVAHLESTLAARLERKPDDSQEWAKIDGAIAFHLIERHADDWNDAGRMMDAWRDANRAAPVPDTGIPTAGEVASIDGPEFRNYLWQFQRNPFSTREINDLIKFIDSHPFRRASLSTTPTSGAVEKAESDAGAVNYTVGRNHCDCHPETCCCDPWAIFGRGGKKHSTHFARSTADEIAAALNKSAAPHPSEAPTCTCPSGDGSLRWPCPVHPSEAKAGEDA